MKDKICLITGATSGIGRAAARALAAIGATVIVVGRSLERCENTVGQIKGATNNPNVDYLVADLSIQSQIRQLAGTFLNRYNRLDVLINNAGAFFLQRQLSADGIEMTFAVNHLAYFLLTNLLLETIKSSAPARIINVASNSHKNEKLDFNDIQMSRHYNGFRSYGRSKLANVLFTYELTRRLKGMNISVNALHPGFVATNIGRNNGLLVRLFMPLAQINAISSNAGARTVVYLASSQKVAGISGKYYIKEKAVRSDPISYNRSIAERLWQVSAEMTGLE